MPSLIRSFGRVLTVAPAMVCAVASHAFAHAPAPCNNMWTAWSPDGRQIVFVSDRTGDPEVFVRTIDDGAERRLTNTPGRDAHPSFSPDGRQIAFQSPREDGQTNLYLMLADGTGQRPVTSHTGFAGMPVWSPDGTHLAYQWTPDLEREKWRVMMVTLSTGEVWPLTDGAANDQVINWAPTGRQLVFHSDRHGRNQLFTMTNRGVATRLTTTDLDDRSGAFSPDGRRLAFMSDREGGPNGVPFFSPDGEFVLASPSGASGQEIHRVRVSDGTSERLAACTGFSLFPFPSSLCKLFPAATAACVRTSDEHSLERTSVAGVCRPGRGSVRDGR